MTHSPDDIDPDSGVSYRHLNHPAHKYTLSPKFRANGGEFIALLAISAHILGIIYAILFVRSSTPPATAWITGYYGLLHRQKDVVINPYGSWRARRGGAAAASPEDARPYADLLDDVSRPAVERYLQITAQRRQSADRGDGCLATRYLEERLRNVLNGVSNDGIAEKFALDRFQSFTYVMSDAELVAQVVNAVKRFDTHGADMRLFGEPVAVKDNISVRDVPFTNGSPLLVGYKPSYTAPAVEMLLDNGAIIIGKTAMDEFGVGSATRAALNPFSTDRLTGGSSGGSANAVGGGIIELALGTDTGGSVIVPAGYCGCVGYRPSFGLINRFGMSELAAKFDTIGTCTRNVLGAARLAAAMMGPGAEVTTNDHTEHVLRGLEELISREGADDREYPLKGLRIASMDTETLVRDGLLDEDVAANMRNVEDALRGLGAEVVLVPPLPLRLATESYHTYVAAQMASNLQRFADLLYHPAGHHMSLDDVTDKMSADTTNRFLAGISILRGKHDVEAVLKRVREALVAWLEQNAIFKDIPLILSPTSARLPPYRDPAKNKSHDLLRDDLYATFAPFIGACAVSFPTGMSADGMPHSAQLVGKRFGDALLLEVAATYEKRASPFKSTPPTA
ncbi:amidase family protein, putative [Babesia bigemina]|uniref:Amidase family protein, putative n=1 Tax=Babesia bigemina TaxID=5866 RepID=A0A061DEK7_BABBI|nr:amidase family protein, putative [Babesia bigemina]CDR97450.1 amidase family protein, putative [Babesia bigemina]|eukprot:XP_012769636.1 amidase family protein, putative [Babesia bigemina]